MKTVIGCEVNDTGNVYIIYIIYYITLIYVRLIFKSIHRGISEVYI